MSRSFMVRSALVVVLGALALALGAVVAAKDGPSAPAGLQAAIENEPLVKVLDVPAAEGAESRAMFVQATSAGFVCVWDAPSANSRMRQGGCNPEDDPLAGRAVSASLAYEGGPAIHGVKDARLVGLASFEASNVYVLMSDSSRRELKLKVVRVGALDFEAFAYRFKKADLKRGIGPSAIVALDASGHELGRQPTGIGG